MLSPLIDGKYINVWDRSLSECFYKKNCVEDDALLVLHFLNLINLDQLEGTVVARKKPGKPKKMHSIHTFLRDLNIRDKNERVAELVSFLKTIGRNILCRIHSYQLVEMEQSIVQCA